MMVFMLLLQIWKVMSLKSYGLINSVGKLEKKLGDTYTASQILGTLHSMQTIIKETKQIKSKKS